jgi:septal ring factor EnvC (AmiA/AmiB activator)
MEQENERIAVVEKAVENIEKGMSRMESKLDSLLENIEKKYVPRTEMEATVKRLEEKIDDQDVEMKAMKERNGKVVGGLVTAIVTLGAAVIDVVFK